MEFEALLSSKQTASDRPLFDEAGKASTLFTARPAKLMGSWYNWIQEDGSQVAEEMRDVLVAVWMLKLWYETAETRQAKREELEQMMPPVSSYQDWNYAKKVGTLGGFAGAGGGVIASGYSVRAQGVLRSTQTATVTTTKAGLSTVTTTPTLIQTLTETWVQPTPTAYNSLNYYQYLNGYNYNDATLPGLGGGGYATSHWNGNYSFYTSGLTCNINFASPNWPSGPVVCQLPGQASATDCTQWTVVFQGFLYAAVAGTYTVHMPTLAESLNWQDNSGFWWGESEAYSSYADGNVDGRATGAGVPGVSNSLGYQLVAGEFLPSTFIYSNG
ncbi:hypothetical protein BJX99DRAFT_253230 [Aspergillus californicus]